ncbi:hypothetical protein [Winogradskyella sp.]|uniref:hypothetical protein n=1 Tax=Winogradskyella sp. TaxID=1883156 RepID=UPI0026312BE2|nr:hypothetical protein [Winogradskyella sp.]
MAPIKFEEQLKDKLEKRSLQPSTDSWAKLSERLDAEEKNSRRPWLGWLSIAAGIIILLAIVVRTFGPNNAQETTPKMVEQEAIDKSIENQLPISNEKESIELVVEDETLDSETDNSKTEEVPEIINYKTVVTKRTETQLVDNTITDESKSQESEKVIKNTNELPKTVIDETIINKEAVVDVLKELRTEKTKVTDREVDSLLKLASKELVRDKLLKNTSTTVDAQSLLEDVEDEMGQSFRSKVYEALKDGYKTVKTAVAQRNN